MSFVQRLRSLPPVGQIALAFAIGLTLLALMVTAYLALRPNYGVLFSDVRPADAATIIAKLDEDKVPYKLEDGGATILVPTAQIDQTRLAIMGSDLPLKGAVGFELFNKSDMGLTEFAQRINYQRALQGELARTIMTIDAIETARVHLTLPEPSIFRAERRPAKASVTLSTRRGHILTSDTVGGIQRLVSASVADLEPLAVVVIDAQGVPVTGMSVAATDDRPSSLVQQTRAVEHYYAATLLHVLEPLYPDVKAEVLVPLDQWDATDTASADRDQALQGWTPNDRGFRITANVSAPTPFTQTQKDDIARLTAGAIGWSHERGDLLLFPVWSAQTDAVDAPVRAVEAAPVPAVTAPQTAQPPFNWLSFLPWLGLGALIIGILAGLVILRRRAHAPLTAQQRTAFAQRLKRLLAEDAGHGR